ncbi:uncharacterized protein LOC142331190 [Lycorma delicatula]|uniref:uncharacterized protein LOC142331190 n=1 Tax=Lycorma delicatula TaxID=130591 RepID=UPI003F50EA19
MYCFNQQITHCALICLMLTPAVICEKLENKDNSRSKRTVGLLLQSLASFLNVQDVEGTTPVTFTTSAPGYRRKSPPPKVQKWPPLDLEITPWVLSAVPTTVATPPTSPNPATSIHPTTEEPGVHAQVIIIPLTEPENHLNPQVGIKKEPDVYLRPEGVNRRPIKYSTGTKYQNPQLHYQPALPYYQSSLPHQQTEVYFWQRLVPDVRTAKQIHYFNQQQPHPQQYQQMPQQQHQQRQQQQQKSHQQKQDSKIQQNNNNTITESSHKQLQLQQKEAEALFRLGYLYGQTIKDELSNLAGNDFNRENQDKYRSFIELEPDLRYTHHLPSKNNELSQLYLLERSRRLKNLKNIMKLPGNKRKMKYDVKSNDESEKTDVEIVKSVEPLYFNVDFEEKPKEEKESVQYKSETNEKVDDSPAFEMVKSYEITNSEISNDNKDFEFHMDPEESPEKNTPLIYEQKFKDVYQNKSGIKHRNNSLKNKKITFIPPSEREKYDQKKSVIGDQINRINNYFTSDKIYPQVYEGKQSTEYSKERLTDNISNDYKYETPKQEINYENFNNGSPEIQDQFKKLSYEFPRQSPNRGKIKYHYNGGLSNDQSYNEFSSKDQSLKSPLSDYTADDDFERKENLDSNSHQFAANSKKLNDGYKYFTDDNAHTHYYKEYSDQNTPNSEKKLSEDVNNNYNFPLHYPEAQLHIFIPDEESLQSPEKQEKSETPQYQYSSPTYYQDYTYQVQGESQGGMDIVNKGPGVSIPRLPDSIHEQIAEHNGVRRNLVPPPSFDQETDTSEHNVKCLPQPFTKLRYSCKTLLSLKQNQSLR